MHHDNDRISLWTVIKYILSKLWLWQGALFVGGSLLGVGATAMYSKGNAAAAACYVISIAWLVVRTAWDHQTSAHQHKIAIRFSIVLLGSAVLGLLLWWNVNVSRPATSDLASVDHTETPHEVTRRALQEFPSKISSPHESNVPRQTRVSTCEEDNLSACSWVELSKRATQLGDKIQDVFCECRQKIEQMNDQEREDGLNPDLSEAQRTAHHNARAFSVHAYRDMAVREYMSKYRKDALVYRNTLIAKSPIPGVRDDSLLSSYDRPFGDEDIAEIAGDLRRLTSATGIPTKNNAGWRTIEEWQKVQFVARLKAYPCQKVRILQGTGAEIAEYTNSFRDVFRRSGWKIVGVQRAASNQPLADIALSMNRVFFGRTPPASYTALRSELTTLGIKCYLQNCGYTADENVAEDEIVFWVGPQTPKGVQGDMLNPPLTLEKP